MRVLFDQATPVPIRLFLTGHVVSTAAHAGWSVPPSRFKKPFDGGAKVQQGPRNASDGACGRNDEGYPLTSRAKGKTQRSERAQRVQRSHGDPERRDIHPTDRRSNEPAEGF